jgi:hypothetical protein
LAGHLRSSLAARGELDATLHADLLADLLLTARKIQRHVAGAAMEDRKLQCLMSNGRWWTSSFRH